MDLVRNKFGMDKRTLYIIIAVIVVLILIDYF